MLVADGPGWAWIGGFHAQNNDHWSPGPVASSRKYKIAAGEQREETEWFHQQAELGMLC